MPEIVVTERNTFIEPPASGNHKCKQCGEVIEDGCEMDGCRDPDCPEQVKADRDQWIYHADAHAQRAAAMLAVLNETRRILLQRERSISECKLLDRIDAITKATT